MQLIVKNVPSVKTMSRMCRANRLMESIARPVLYQDIYIREGDYGAHSILQQQQRFEALAKAILGNHSLGVYVQVLDWPHIHDDTWRVLKLLPNLRELCIDCAATRDPVVLTDLEFPHLERVLISGLWPLGGLAALMLKAPNLKYLQISGETVSIILPSLIRLH